MAHKNTVFLPLFCVCLALTACDADSDSAALLVDEGASAPETTVDGIDTLALAPANTAGPETVPVSAQMPCGPGSDLDTGVIVALHDDVRDQAGDLVVDCDLGGTLPNSWRAAPSFDPLSSDVPDKLARYCRFEYTGGGSPQQSDYDAMFDAIDQFADTPLSTAAVDCVNFEPSSGLSHDPGIEAAANAAFRANVGAIDSLAGVLADPIGLYIVDTCGGVQTCNNDHAVSMVNLATDLLCPRSGNDDYCIEHIHWFYSAMPRIAGNSAPQLVYQGGNVGSFDDAAQALYSALTDWRQLRGDHGAEVRAVFLAAFGGKKGLNIDVTRGSAAQLRDVINYVNCSGGVIVAAAGNDDSPSCPIDSEDPLFPALLEVDQALDSAACHTLGFEPLEENDYPVFDGARPAVHAVGILDGHDEEPAMARELALPPLAAYGTYAWAPNAHDMVPLTGTSISALVTATVLTASWSLHAELTPTDITQAVYDGGYDTGISADFALSGTPNVHRVSMCGAFNEVCSLQNVSCAAYTCDAPAAPPSDGNMQAVYDAIDSALADTLASSTMLTQAAASSTGASCELPSPTDLATPQPEHPVCPYCEIGSGSGGGGGQSLYVDVLPVYKGDITGGKLLTYDNIGELNGTFSLAAYLTVINEAASGEVVEIPLSSVTASYAVLTLDVSDEPVTNEIPVGE